MIKRLAPVVRPESIPAWLRRPILALDDEKPMELIARGEYRGVAGYGAKDGPASSLPAPRIPDRSSHACSQPTGERWIINAHNVDIGRSDDGSFTRR
jgi:hypothetical protein